jgi:hypothetical protein
MDFSYKERIADLMDQFTCHPKYRHFSINFLSNHKGMASPDEVEIPIVKRNTLIESTNADIEAFVVPAFNGTSALMYFCLAGFKNTMLVDTFILPELAIDSQKTRMKVLKTTTGMDTRTWVTPRVAISTAPPP